MKFLRHFLTLAVALLVAFASSVQAQNGDGDFTTDAVPSLVPSGELLTFVCPLDSVDLDTSKAFSLGRYDYGIRAGQSISVERVITSAGTPKITTYIDKSFDKTNWLACDTIGTDVTSKTRTVIQVDLNASTAGSAPWYRMRAIGVATNTHDSIIYYKFYLHHRDE